MTAAEVVREHKLVAKGIDAQNEVIAALDKIEREGLYRNTHSTFESYVRARFGNRVWDLFDLRRSIGGGSA